jgi:hypothetical protein
MNNEPNQAVGATDPEVEYESERPLEELADADLLFAESTEDAPKPSEPGESEPSTPKDVGTEEGKSKRSTSLGTRIQTFARPFLDVYMVLLGLSALAILIGILCLFLELWRYNFDIKAKNYHSRRMNHSHDSFDGPLIWAMPADVDCYQMSLAERTFPNVRNG